MVASNSVCCTHAEGSITRVRTKCMDIFTTCSYNSTVQYLSPVLDMLRMDVWVRTTDCTSTTYVCLYELLEL